MYKTALHKTSKCLWPVHIDVYVVKWMGFFWRFHKSLSKNPWKCSPQNNTWSIKFWDVYDVSLLEKRYGKSMTYKAESVFPITYFKAEAVMGRRFSKIGVPDDYFVEHISVAAS